MHLVRTRLWYVASIALGLAAVGIEMSAKNSAANAGKGMAKATQARVDGVPLEVREAIKTEASAAAHRSDTLSRTGLCVAFGSAASLFVSTYKRESRWNSVPVTVLIAYIIWFLVLV